MDKSFTSDELIDYVLGKLDAGMRLMAFPAQLSDKIRSVSVKVTFNSGVSADYRIDDVADKVRAWKSEKNI